MMEAIVRARTPSMVDRASGESILTRQNSTASMKPAPMEHIGSLKEHQSPQEVNDEPPMSPLALAKSTSRSRPTPLIVSSQKNKANRLSLNFPIQLPADYPTSPSFSPANHLISETTTAEIKSPVPQTSSADPPNHFLQDLARRERRVLELKEELGRAEGELETLKKKWAYREVHKKRSEIRAVEQKVPNTPKSATTSPSTAEQRDGMETPRRSAEMTADRRKAMLLAGMGRESRRKVLEGRHTRTLSLLSPDRMNFSTPASPGCYSPLVQHGSVKNVDAEPGPASSERTTVNGCVPLNMGNSGSSTLSDLQTNLFKPRNRHSYNDPPSTSNCRNMGSANDVLTTGKRLAEDFKAGLWTFVEDLRQATVGDELSVNNNRMSTRSPAVGFGINAMMNMGIAANPQYVGGAGHSAAKLLTPSPKIKSHEEGRGDRGCTDGSNRNSAPIAKRDYTTDLHKLIPADEEGLLGPSSSADASSSTRKSTEKERTKRKSITAPQQEDLTADDWLNWDSPNSDTSSRNSKGHSDFTAEDTSQRWSSSTLATVISNDEELTPTLSKSNCNNKHSKKEDKDGGAIQWPALTTQSFSPRNLKRTAESLMREWEKTLTPPPEEDGANEKASNSGRSFAFGGQDLLR